MAVVTTKHMNSHMWYLYNMQINSNINHKMWESKLVITTEYVNLIPLQILPEPFLWEFNFVQQCYWQKF